MYWRFTDSPPTWRHARWVGSAAAYAFDGLVIDKDFFGVASANERVEVFPRRGERC